MRAKRCLLRMESYDFMNFQIFKKLVDAVDLKKKALNSESTRLIYSFPCSFSPSQGHRKRGARGTTAFQTLADKLTQGPLMKWTENSLELRLLKIGGAPITHWG